MAVLLLLNYYFKAYRNPYQMKDVIDLSEGWSYSVDGAERRSLETLRTGPQIGSGETITLYRRLDEELTGAAVLIRTNHQSLNVFVDAQSIFVSAETSPGQNPGMALHFIQLPADYLSKTLKIELTSPYQLYAGRTSPILMGTVTSLEAYALSKSIRSTILMSMCLLIGLSMILLSLVQALCGFVRPQTLFIGIFGLIWAFYYVCTEYIVFQFFSPFWVSTISLGLYFAFSVPLTLFFYFSFIHYRRQMMPAVMIHGVFSLAAILLQLFDIVDMPRLVNINNIVLTGLAYTIILAGLEAKRGNRLMKIAVPFFLVAYISMLYNFYVFYSRQGVVPYTYKDTYFMLLLCILAYNVWLLADSYYMRKQENEVLILQNRSAQANYEQIKTHLKEVGSLKHEVKKHLAVLHTYLSDKRYAEAENYLEQYAVQASKVADVVYHDNFLINTVAGYLADQGREQGIPVEIDIKTETVNISDTHLYSLLTNIVDNALEACRKIPDTPERYIRLMISRREPYLQITCQNSFNGIIQRADSLFGKITTTKSERGHGYGLWSIEQIAEAYNGFVDITYDTNCFTITVALKDQSGHQVN